MKPKTNKIEEVNAMKTPTGVLILEGIRNQGQVVCNIASSLSEFGSPYYSYRYGNDHDGDEQPATDVPEAVTEMVSAMKDSAKNLLRMVNSFARAEAGAADVTIDGPDDAIPADTDESFILNESGDGDITAVFTEAGTATVTKGQVTGTMIVAGMNLNRSRFYTEAALQEAAANKLWNGKPMYLDHMSESAKQDSHGVRSVKDVAAIIKETRYDSGTKSIKYVATLADPTLEGKLAYMQERGILSGIGVSIHASGQGKREVIESAPTFVVEKFVEAYSTDFVTTPGAGGTIDMLESNPAGNAVVVEETTGENSMDEKTMAALLESVGAIVAKAIAPLAESQAKVQGRLDAVETQGKIKTMIEAANLPDMAKAQLVARFAEATTTDGVDAAIKGMSELVESFKVAKTDDKVEVTEVAGRRVAKPSPVHGMGAQAPTEGTPNNYRGTKDFIESPVAKLLGGKDKAEKLFESLR